MNTSTTSPLLNHHKRLISLDFVRGLTMVLLTLESTELYEHLKTALSGTAGSSIIEQFFHHEWHGLHLWDIVQPMFMFIAGTAMAFSLTKYRERFSWGNTFVKVLKRSGWLFFWGVLDYAVRKEGLSFELWNVLTQLSFTTLVAFLIMDFPVIVQIVISFLFLLIPELLYRYTNIPGFDQPFTNQHNFGNFMDLVLMNKVNKEGWVAINCLSTSAHTIWGMLAGKLLITNKTDEEKVKYLIISGISLLILGFGLDIAGITPIIKKIATSSFVLASGGYCVLFIAAAYWWIDMRKHQNNILLFRVFGMNSIFIYLFLAFVAGRWFTGYVFDITNGLFGIIHFPQIPAEIIGSLIVFALETGMLFFLYRKKIFFKL